MTFSLKEQVLFDPSNLSAFGTLESDSLTPLVQMDFVHGINSQLGLSSVTGSGSVDTNAQRLRIQTGTNSTSSAIFKSKKSIKYRAGQGILGRFSFAFSTPRANSTQMAGAGSAADGYFFGYDGTQYGIFHRFNGSILDFIPQSSWNGDKCDGNGATQFDIIPQFGNVYMIKYPYLGYGNILFYILDRTSGRWLLVHTIQYTNTTTTVQITNPTLSFYVEFVNAGNTTNLIGYCGSVGMFLSGERSFEGCPRWAADSIKTGITTEALMISIRNATTYNGVTNRSLIRMNSVSVSATNTGTAATVVIRFKINATVGGTPSFSPIDGITADAGVTITSGNSVSSIDKAGTTIASGTYIFNIAVASIGSTLIDLTPFDIFINPTEILSITAQASNSSSIGISANWSEEI